MTDPAHQSASRRKILLLAALFALPVVIAYALYFSGWRPAATGNHGELVQPPRPVADVMLTRLDGRPMQFRELQGKWTLLIFSAAECLKSCERNLHNLRQVIAAQGEKSERVQSALVVTDTKALDLLRYTVKDYPDLHVIVGPPAAVAELARQFALPAGGPLEDPGRIYLVDPLGNFMMSYPAGADPNGIRKDLARLLRVSRIG